MNLEKHPDDQRVLLVDRSELFRLALRHVLLRYLRVSEVSDASSAQEMLGYLAGPHCFSLLVVDAASISAETGTDREGLCQLGDIRQRHPNLRIALTTLSDERRTILGALEAGVHGIITKTSSADEWGRALRVIVSGDIYVPSSVAALAPGVPASQPVGSRSKYDLPASVWDCLSQRQREILRLLTMGETNKEIARTLHISEGTVKIHLAALFRNLRVSKRASAAVIGMKLLGEKQILTKT